MPESAQEKGLQFERDWSERFGLDLVPGSGAVWHSKLDLKSDRRARWSLKYTEKKSYSIKTADIDEAVDACEGPGGDGSVPVWGFRIGGEGHELIALRPDDFELLQRGELRLVGERETKGSERRRRSTIPVLMREESE